MHPIQREPYVIPWPAEAAAKGGHKKFMHKEIHEQPHAMVSCLTGRLRSADEPVAFENIGLTHEEIRKLQKVVFTACGTAFHASLVGRFLMDRLARIPADADLAAELRQRDPVISPDTLCVVVSQSGETADTLEAMRTMKRKGAKVIGVINVVDSSIARESDGVAYIQAGPEIGVASTKAYTSQLLTLRCWPCTSPRSAAPPARKTSGRSRKHCSPLPAQIQELLKRENDVLALARNITGRTTPFTWRGELTSPRRWKARLS